LTKTVEPTVILSGDTVDYTYDIYNCGTVELSSLTLNDDQLGPITLPSTTLAAGDSMTVYVNDVQLFENTTNLATVCGTAPTQDVVCSNDTATVTIVSPGILLIKTVDPETIFSGETVDYTFEIYNIGDVELSGITLVDDQLGPITLPTTTLGVGASMTVTVNDVVLYVTTTNTAVVTGYSPNQDMVQSQDDATVVVQCPANPSISLNKTVKPETIYPGETVDYNFEIWNNGETSLSGITLVDDHLGPITLPTTSLAIGESMTVNVNDVMICQNTTNYAEVAGYSPIQELVTDDDTATVIVIAPCINIIKTVSPETIFLGDTATWNITVENTGDVILTDVIVTDDNMGVLGSMITLLPGEIIYFEYTTSPLQTILNTAIVEGKDPIGGIVSDTDSARVIVLIPCPPEVWVDDSWHNQLDVNLFNPDLVWGYDAFRVIQDGIDAVCECGIVHVRAGYYIGQILINKSLALLGDPGAKIFGDNLNIYTIDVSQETYKPIIFAFAGTLVGNNVITNGNIGVTVDGFEIDGNNEADSIAILYHNVKDMCQPAQISNNRILKVDIAIQINGCTDSTTIIYNKIPWENQISDKIAVLITPFGGCDPSGVEIHYNYWGVECGWNIGVWNQGTVIANATFNWWGADDGPASLEGYDNYDAITGRLADGYGDRVIGLVHFDPWWGVESSASASKYNAHVGELICFSASDSFAYDETGDITNKIKYKWNFGDGMYSFSKNYCRSYSQPGTYTVSLMVEVSSYDLDNEFVAGYLRDWDTFTIVVV